MFRTRTRTRTRTATIAAAAAMALGLAACGDQGEELPEEDTMPVDGVEPPGDGDDDSNDNNDNNDDNGAGGADDGAPPADEDLPGEVIETFPFEGDELAVVVVAHDDVLNVREIPDPQAPVLTELDPLTDGVVATGHNRTLEEWGIWAEVQAEGVTGWANVTYLGYLGQTEDAGDDFDGLDPADSAEELAQAVGERAAELNGSAEIDNALIAIADISGPSEAPDVTIDVTGIPDDAQMGERLLMRAGTDPSGLYQVEFVERTVICARGVEDELCL